MSGKITGFQLRIELKDLGWSQRVLSEKLGVGQDTVSRWVTGKVDVPTYATEYLRLVKLIKSLSDEV